MAATKGESNAARKSTGAIKALKTPKAAPPPTVKARRVSTPATGANVVSVTRKRPAVFKPSVKLDASQITDRRPQGVGQIVENKWAMPKKTGPMKAPPVSKRRQE